MLVGTIVVRQLGAKAIVLYLEEMDDILRGIDYTFALERQLTQKLVNQSELHSELLKIGWFLLVEFRNFTG
jgi:hypothetical protein